MPTLRTIPSITRAAHLARNGGPGPEVAVTDFRNSFRSGFRSGFRAAYSGTMSGAPSRAASAVRSSGWRCDSRSASTRFS